MTAHVYAISSNKGGVGKTSLVSNLAGAIAKQGKQVLIVDTDAQGNASIAFGYSDPNVIEYTLYDVLMGKKKAKDIIIDADDDMPNLHILPSNSDMNYLEIDILPHIQESGVSYLRLLHDAIQPLLSDYDYIFIDTPPSMGLVAWNVLVAADKVIVPFVPEPFATNGLVNVIEAVKAFKEREGLSLEIAGVVGMMVQKNVRLHEQLLADARAYCDTHDITMYDTSIPRSVEFANATGFDTKPAVWTSPTHTAVKTYFNLMEEVLNNGKS